MWLKALIIISGARQKNMKCYIRMRFSRRQRVQRLDGVSWRGHT
jgi:hypothetical protein